MMSGKSIVWRWIAVAASVILCWTNAYGDIDKKLYKRAAEKVWGMAEPQFDAKADLSDSLYQNRSAVYIARYTGMVAKYDGDMNQGKLSAIGVANNNAVDAVYVDRVMVKLNDAAAVEYFSEFTVDAPMKQKVGNHTLISVKPAFGARIIKPDGSVKDVDMSEALTVTSGKKGKKDEEYKVALAGLEPGDVLEYFHYTECYYDELMMPAMSVKFLRNYPTRHLKLDYRVSPKLAFEYGSYNGAPQLEILGRGDDGLNHATMVVEGVESIEDDMPFFSLARQMPYMLVYVLNNASRLDYVPASARPGGMRHTALPFFIQDVTRSINDCKVPDKVVNEAAGVMKEWCKTHGDASDRELLDGGWMALRHALYKLDERFSGRQFAIALSKLAGKMGVADPVRVAVTSSRFDVPVDKMVYFNDAHYMAVAGDVCYFTVNDMYNVPGEVPSRYAGEQVVMFDGNVGNEKLHMGSKYIKVPGLVAKNNLDDGKVTLKLNPDNEEELTADMELTMTGSCKARARKLLLDEDAMDVVAKYLGTQPVKRKKQWDAEKEMENQREAMSDFAKLMWGSDDAEMKEYSINSYGCTPSEPEVKLTLNGKVPGCVTQAGDNLLVNVGKFIGKQHDVKGDNRRRDISVIRDAADRTVRKIRFEIPEGYTVKPGSLEDMARNVVVPEGAFYASASVDGNVVSVDVMERYSRNVYPASSWDNLLKISDAAVEYQRAAIVLTPAE